MDVHAPPRTARRAPGALLALAIGLMALALPSLAAAADRNDDNIPDRWEKRHGLSLKVNQAKRDQDRDKLVNKREHKFGMDPLDDDSDDDGTEDGEESSGVISAYDPDTGLLTIDLALGGSVTGLVTEDTEVDCDDGDDHGDEDEDGEGDGDHSGPGHGDDDDDVEDGGDDVDEDQDEGDDKRDSGPGHDGDDDDENDDEGECSVDDLAIGALVQEAELEIEDGQAVWEEIELLVEETDDSED
jgi:hypothetical protein